MMVCIRSLSVCKAAILIAVLIDSIPAGLLEIQD